MPSPSWPRERLALSLAAAALLILALGLLRPAETAGLDPELFWVNKLSWRGCADVVVLGDSRAYLGVAPAVLGRRLPGLRVLNFGFDNLGFSRDYLNRAEQVLDPRSPARTVLIGFSPHALTAQARDTNQFRITRAQMERFPPRVLRLKLAASRLVHRFADPFPPEKLLGMAGLVKTSRFEREYLADGWLKSSLEPPQPRSALDNAPSRFAGNQVSPKIENELLDSVSRWTKAGIRVIVVRVPTSSEMVALENRLGGFDEAAFRARLQAAGGRWIEVDQNAYPTYDGSHLDWRSAERFSADLASSFQLTTNNRQLVTHFST